MKCEISILFVIFTFGQNLANKSFRCLSCWRGCESSNFCDCSGPDANISNGSQVDDEHFSYCNGSSCFVKFEKFEEEGVSFVIKGCSNARTVKNAKPECQYVDDLTSIQCRCASDECNLIYDMNFIAESRFKSRVLCCEWTTNGDEFDDQTVSKGPGATLNYARSDGEPDECKTSCNFGDYCYSRSNGDRGCVVGLPSEYSAASLNMTQDIKLRTMCISTHFDDSPSERCFCGTDFCNHPNSTFDETSQNVSSISTSSRSDENNFGTSVCHRYTLTSDSPITIENLATNATRFGDCFAQYCFWTITTKQIVLDPLYPDDSLSEADYDKSTTSNSRQNETSLPLPYFVDKYEVNGGCLNISVPSLVTLGCMTEFTDDKAPLTKYCVCRGNFCNDQNYFSLSVVALSSDHLPDPQSLNHGVAKLRKSIFRAWLTLIGSFVLCYSLTR